MDDSDRYAASGRGPRHAAAGGLPIRSPPPDPGSPAGRAVRSTVRLFRLCGLLHGALAAGPASLSATQAERPIGLDDLRAVRGLPWVEISPDGRRVGYVLDGDSEGAPPSGLWVVDVAGGDPLRLTDADAVRSVAGWSESSDAIAFVADAGGEPHAWIVTPGGAARPVCPLPRGARGLVWTDGGATLGFTAPPPADGTRGEGSGGPRLSNRVPPGESVFACDVATGSSRRVTADSFHGLEAAWSPAGDRLVIAAQEDPGFYGALESDLFEVDLVSGETAALVVRPGVDRTPVFSPTGDRLAFVTGFGRSGLLPNLGIGFVDPDDGAVSDAGRVHDRGGLFEGPSIHGWSESGDVYYSAVDGVRTPLFRLSPDGRVDTVAVDAAGRAAYAYSLSADARTLAFKRSSTDRPPEVHAQTADGEVRRLTDVNGSLAALGVPAAEVVTWRGPDGAPLEGLLMRPAGAEAPVPLITVLHGGPASAYTLGFPGLGFFNPYQDMLLAARGYAVFLPNPRGSGGYGAAFRAAARGDWGEGPARDVLAGIDHLIETGVADPGRLGLAGWSYGGYLTAWILTLTDRFAVASVGAGVTDLASHFGQSAPQMLDYFGAPPWEMPRLYRSQSPIYRADRIRTPTLFFHGGSDESVSPSQSELLHAALEIRGVPSELVVYPGEGHSLRDPASQDDSWERFLEWVDRRIGPGGPPSVAEDVRTLDGVMRAYYEVVSAGPGERRDFARDSLLHHPEARVGMMGEDPRGEAWLRTMTLGEYHEMLGATVEEGFYEREIDRATRRFGHLAHVWSAYAWRSEPDGPDRGRGINSLQLYHDGERWWILSWFFDSERPGNPLPARPDRR